MRSGICRIHVRVLGFVSEQSQYAYGDHNTRTGIKIVRDDFLWTCMPLSPGARSFPFVTRVYRSKPTPVRISGDPVCKRAGTAKISHMGRHITQNESVPIRGPTYIYIYYSVRQLFVIFNVQTVRHLFEIFYTTF